MNLVFDIGNTYTKTGLFDRGNLLESQRLETITPDVLKLIFEKILTAGCAGFFRRQK